MEELKKSMEELKASKSAADKGVLEEKRPTLRQGRPLQLWRERMTLSMPRLLCWVNNPDMDLTFLEGKLEKNWLSGRLILKRKMKSCLGVGP